jgi:fibronectin type 3 domain-containing protein
MKRMLLLTMILTFPQLVSAASVQLAWDAVTDTRVVGYTLERCTGSSCTNFVPIATAITGTSFNDTTVQPATSYRWQVRSADAKGATSAPSKVVTFLVPDTQLPAPTNLRGTIVP